MNVYSILVSAYYQIISVFPPVIQWLSWLFVILLVILLPFLIPVLWGVFVGIWHFLVFLLQQTSAKTPAP
jgi:hypothetical protein